MDIRLTDDQIAHFHEQGYLSLDRITTDAELDQLRVIYDRIFSERIGWDDGAQFDLGGNEADDRPVLPQILNPTRYFPELAQTTYRKNVWAIANQLYPDVANMGEHMIYKPARYGGPTPWHQDQAYHSPRTTYRGINAWMPLDDATIENGCMHFVPGSHTLDVLPHHSINHDRAVHGLEVDEPEKWHAQGIAAPIPAGGVTLHAAFMLHYAPANNSDRPRRAYILTAKTEAVERETPVDNYWTREKETPRMARARQAQAEHEATASSDY